jgi:hypothetical protein
MKIILSTKDLRLMTSTRHSGQGVFFEVLVFDPRRGCPVGGGGIHHTCAFSPYPDKRNSPKSFLSGIKDQEIFLVPPSIKNLVEKDIYLEAENNKEILTKKVNRHGNF